MLGLSLDFWRHLRIALPTEAWREFLEQVRAWHGCGGIIASVDEARWSIATAVYWLAEDFGASEFDALRCAENLTGYSPSPLHRRIEDARDELATLLYDACAEYLKGAQ
jgi:hypothetical protein